MPGAEFTRTTRVLLANAAALALVGLGVMALTLVVNRVDWALVWLAVGLAASQMLLVIVLRGRRDAKSIEPTIDAMVSLMDAQTDAIFAQQGEIAHLRASLVTPPAQATRKALANQAMPGLSGVVERLAQAEASLPEMLPQTRAWIGKVRGLATQTQAQIEAMSGDTESPPSKD